MLARLFEEGRGRTARHVIANRARVPDVRDVKIDVTARAAGVLFRGAVVTLEAALTSTNAAPSRAPSTEP